MDMVKVAKAPPPAAIHAGDRLCDLARETYPDPDLRWEFEPAALIAAGLAAAEEAAGAHDLRDAEARLAAMPAKVAGKKLPLHAH
jgi:hypothetical protein